MQFVVDKDVHVSMRDGVRLATDVWRPVSDEPVPTLLVRTPYGKDELGTILTTGVMPDHAALVAAGYAVVVQDCRGTFRSEGEFAPIAHETDDGADTIDWLRAQPWCDGAIGMFGPSYLGFTQWAAVGSGVDGLRAVAPSMTSTDFYRAGWYSSGGAMSLHTAQTWTMLMASMTAQRAVGAGEDALGDLLVLSRVAADPTQELAALPTIDREWLGQFGAWWREFTEHATHDDHWRDLTVPGDFEVVTQPALHIAGWYDVFLAHQLRTFATLRDGAATLEAREGQRLVVGPWHHGAADAVYPSRQFGPTAAAAMCDITGLHRRFFDRWLRGDEAALERVAPVRIFVMGIDQWRDEQDWPLPDTRYDDLFLSSTSPANTASGGGVLVEQPPTVERRDTFLYDPRRPVPTTGGAMLIGPAATGEVGPVDQRPLATRDDILCFQTPALDEPLEVTGHVRLVLHVESSAFDTDFTGRLIDVFPDGRAIVLCDGILRARHRASLEREELLEPGEPVEIVIDMAATSNVFLPGHRLRLDVSSSSFPRYDRNTNTGGAIAHDGEDALVVAVNHVLHGPEHPSRLILPIIDR